MEREGKILIKGQTQSPVLAYLCGLSLSAPLR